jgi:hypothetical protein
MKIFKPSTLVSLGIAIAAALVTQPVRASFIDSLVITENSSTSLTAMLTTSSGTTPLTVTPGANAETWFITLAGFAGTPGSGLQFWTEPEGGSVNFVEATTNQLGQIFVQSDDAVAASGLANNTPDTTSFTLNGGALSVTFNDKGDVAAAPDTGSTLGLLSLSVVALLGATRLRFLQLAA